MTKPTYTGTDWKNSPENLAMLKAKGFQKGMKKHPASGRKAIPQEIKDAMANLTPDAVRVLADVMENSSNDAARIKAAEAILKPFISAAPTQQTVDVKHTHVIADMLSQVNSLRLKQDNHKTIDITPKEIEEE